MTAFNHEVADKLRKISSLLEAQHANPFRSRAYRNAAITIEQLQQDVRQLVQAQGITGLVELPAIGNGIARSIYEYVAIGRMSRLENLQGTSDPISLFQSIPTVGRELAQRIHDSLHVDTLESLENAVHQGQLDQVEGLGTKRKQAIEAWLAKHLGERSGRSKSGPHAAHGPSIDLLLKVDDEYRNKVDAGKLPLIAPKRFNPDNRPWLPILHTHHGDWHFTALYSNSERAHKLNTVFDWVIIYFYDDHHQEGQHTLVTETHGALTGKRVVRGRERECRDYYQSA
ncbi:MAG: DNA-binding protein [Gammaproteobacteria bacterium]|nr:DNA-binding protein [Gammaproteobacteria bacterium]